MAAAGAGRGPQRLGDAVTNRDRRTQVLVLAARRSTRRERREALPEIFRILGDPRGWPGFPTMAEHRRERLVDAFYRWAGTPDDRHPLPPSPSTTGEG